MPFSLTKLIEDCAREAGNEDFNVIDEICSGMVSAHALARGPIWHGMIRKIIAEAARARLSSEQLKSHLNAANAPFTDKLMEAYEKYGEDMTKALERIGYRYPSLTETQWKVSGLMESNNEKRIKAPLVEMTLKALPTGGDKSDEFNFVCTKDELLELQNVVREAENMLAKLVQK
uniref:COMM domain-containing protein 3 n=1 Tax=Panagrolaimus superbus TaxID=310955 RepID=A0A914Z1J5_9BILA